MLFVVLPEERVKVPNPSMALEKGLFCLLLRVGVARLPRPGPGSARLLTLVLLPCRLQPGVLLSAEAGGEAAISAARNCSASTLLVRGCSPPWPWLCRSPGWPEPRRMLITLQILQIV